jgi:hypothetical protein
MNPVVVGVVTGITVVVGKWSKGKAPSIDNAIGVAGISIFLAIIDQANEKLAANFGYLILLTTMIIYLPDIVKATGLGK